MKENVYKAVKWFYVIVVSLAAGTVVNIVLFFGAAFLFAGANGDTWLRWYFESKDGLYFVLVSMLLALPVVPYAKKLNIVSR
jgi:hypothetical protein